MTAGASGSAEVRLLRHSVPEFEPTFQEELLVEGGDLGAFQAVSVFAGWVRDCLDCDTDDDAVKRAFDAVERLIRDNEFPLGDALAAEFIEGVWDHPQAPARMGAATRARARPG